MDCLLIGYSRFARRRVIPALAAQPAIGAIHVASRSAAAVEVPRGGQVFTDYAAALATLPPGLVYVSLTNDAHARWIEAALERGNHVIVDKPAVVELADAERLVALAHARGLVLAEALLYAWHPVIDAVRAVFAEHGVRPTHVVATFTPPVPATDYRHRRALGGGALLDLGPYCVSLGRLLWDEDPASTAACIVDAADVETSYSALLRYPSGAVVGHFGFTTEYTNSVQLLGPALAVTVPRVFSTPPDMATEVIVRHRDQTTTRVVPAADSAERVLAGVLAAIERRDLDAFAAPLVRDARALDRLRRAAQP